MLMNQILVLKKQQKKGTKKRSSSDDVYIPYNQNTLSIYQNAWKFPAKSRRSVHSKVTAYLLSILNTPQYLELSNKIIVDEGFTLSEEDAKSGATLGYGSVDIIITSNAEHPITIVINTQDSNPEKKGLGQLLLQMESLMKLFNYSHIIGIATDGDKWIFVDSKGNGKFEYIEKKDIQDCILTFRKWIYIVATNNMI